MKFLALFLAVLIAPLAAAPRLHVSGPTIVPGTDIEIVLDHEACPADRIGKVAATPWLQIEPAWAGKTVWKEANVLEFQPAEAPQLGTEYTFTLIGEHVYLDGKPVPAGRLGTASTPKPGIDYATLLGRYTTGWSARTAAYYLTFNGEVDPEETAPFFHYTDKKGQRVAAKVRRPDFAELKQPGYIRPTFLQSFEAALSGQPFEPGLAAGFKPSNGLIVEPASPLPVGDEWYLVSRAGLPVGGHPAVNESRRRIGDVDPFKLQHAYARTVADEPRRIVVDFSRSLPKEFSADLVKVEPEVPEMTMSVEGDKLRIDGDFSAHDHWTIFVEGGISSYDGLVLGQRWMGKVKFEHLEPGLGVASEDESQLAHGSRYYRISTVNLDSLKIRIKKLHGSQLVRARQGYRYYTGRGPHGQGLSPQRLMPYEMMVGTTVADFEVELDNPIDTSRPLYLDWDKVLADDPQPYSIGRAPEEPREDASADPAAFFIEIVGEPKSGARPERRKVVQSLVQLTDLGMAWKISGDEVKALVFSCRTGEPVEGVKVDLFGEDAEVLGRFKTGADGMATLPRDSKMRHLRASLGADQFTTPYDDAMPTVGLWRFPVRYSWQESPLEQRRVMLFSDRSLYRPGEEVHVKGLVRRQDGNAIELDAPSKVKFTVTNPTGVEILSEDLEVSAAGSFDQSFRLPEETTGFHRVMVTWQDEHDAAAELENWVERTHAMEGSRATMTLRVEEFRRNAFEITHEIAEPAPGASEVELQLEAGNYSGQPLDGAEVHVWSRVSDRNYYPDRFRDHLFGDHRRPDFGYWYHYFGYRWDDDNGNPRSDTETTELKLDEDGRATVTAKVSEAEFPTLRDVMIQTEVTDSNRQTLSKTSSAMVHPASVYVGVRRIDRLVRVGDELPLDLVAVDTKGAPFEGELEVEATLSREVNEQVRLRTPEGGAVRNEKRDEELSSARLKVGGDDSKYVFAPEKPGRHTLELRGSDAAGNDFATAVTIHVYGTDEYPWAYEDGMRIKLVAEKKLYRPGDTARVLVLSPIEGTALVTVEREKVSRSFTIPLDPTNPVVEIPVTDEDAPNCFVSVLVIKGSDASARKFKEPQLRLGYCELMVENVRDRLQVDITKVDGEYSADPVEGELVSLMPGSDAVIEGRVLDADGRPAAGAEITVYAEDEGTLAVAGYETPDPMSFFYNPRLLRVECGTSLGNFVPESPDEQSFYNKGLFIGGGDGFGAGEGLDAPRRDFNPCAFWMPTVVADAEGRFRIEADLPDTLTRYRLIAVAHQNAARFGHAEDAFLVNKPLMLEPQEPRFANEGDQLAMRATIRNASDLDGEWKITLVPNPPASDPVVALAEGVEESTTITLAAGKAATVSFDVDFRNTGEAVMNWRAEPVKLGGRAPNPAELRRHADAVESIFQVEFPMPLLRQTRLVRLEGGASALDLLEDLDPALLDGRGHLELELSRSLLLEAGGAIDYLLRYPYGCVEQTTSSLIPWLAVERLRAASPELAKHTPDEVRSVISKGVNRLLSMQNSDGGFGYWTSATESSRWSSSYAGLGLIMASKQSPVPPGAVDRLADYLARQLRSIDKDTKPYDLEISARDLWVLAMAGKPQEAYADLLRKRMPDLSSRARCFLAMAEVTAGREGIARELLASASEAREMSGWWMRWQPDDAMKLMAWSAVDRDSPEALAALEKMLRDRNPYGHWNTTWMNAWSVLALAAYAGGEKWEPSELVLDTGGDPEVFTVGTESPVVSRRLPLHPGLKAAVTSDGPAFVRVTLSSKPRITPLQPVSANGLEVTRFYRRVKADGTDEPLDVPKVGDLIRVELRVTLPTDDARYMVVEDRLPGIFEAVNNTFESQAANMNAGATSERSWTVSHNEIRADRVMFFMDRPYGRGTHTLSYLARVTLEGSAYAPPAKVEAMYDPDQLALSASRKFEVE
ncbi:alpha-2-macroglobulin family protein [Haloferula sp. A504]|uniref:alpha-2-macroglobulin family protein n=1 Tax=Haloferula sp. A504 TaxID=3373601 RepID=UPI0031C77F05|nr:MG2 domain-containing protein [Verrucomicrobiaceae bacterium E54]